jgi:hypothetical protein
MGGEGAWHRAQWVCLCLNLLNKQFNMYCFEFLFCLSFLFLFCMLPMNHDLAYLRIDFCIHFIGYNLQ